MRRPTVRKKIFRALKDGPATSLEIAAELRVKRNLATAHMTNGYQLGLYTREKFQVPNDGRPGRRNVWLYSLATAPRASA